MAILHSYTNGNTKVELYSDGTKIRTCDSDKPYVVFPESIDVKITNHCTAKCSYCHEQSTAAGKHGDLNKLAGVLSVLPAGVEIAIGGGNPLDHAELIPFLKWMKRQGLVANITINQKHVGPYLDLILTLIQDQLVYGVGISYSSPAYLPDISRILRATDNLVFHVIMGINQVSDIKDLNDFCKRHNKPCKILVLGYKVFGFGINYYVKNQHIETNKYAWYTQLANYFRHDNLTLSFDNLAIKQLKLQRFFSDEAWSKFYMGDDGRYTMYIDGVNQQYAVSSTSKTRKSWSDYESLLDFFRGIGQ